MSAITWIILMVLLYIPIQILALEVKKKISKVTATVLISIDCIALFILIMKILLPAQ